MTSDDDSRELQESLKDVMRGYPQGVTVVTASSNGKRYGVTVSSFTMVSMSPPLVLISLMKGLTTTQALASCDGFTVNILAEDQRSVSDRFAGRVPLKDRFEGLRFRSEGTTSPVIDGVVGFIDCRKWREYDVGDHMVIVGEVVKAKKTGRKAPLAYYLQQYTAVVQPEYKEPTTDALW